MLFFIVSLFAILSFAIVLDTCVALALWLAFGRTNLFFRMPIFLAALALPGIFCALVEADEWVFILLFVSCIILIGAMMNCRPLVGKVVMGVLLAFLGVVMFCQLPYLNYGRFEPILATWAARFFFATSVMAILFSITRVLGFDVVRLLEGQDDLELERRTGRSIDSWIETLKKAKADKWNRASIATFLSDHGLDFTSQKEIAIAFEKVHGRKTVGISLSGNSQIVAQTSEDDDDERSWFQKPAFEQFGVAQLLMLTFAAACFFRVTSLVYKNLTTLVDFLIAVPLPFLVAFAVMAMLIHFLSVGSGRPKMLVSAAIVFLVLCLLLHFAEQQIGSFGITIGLLALSIPFVLAISALLVQARHRGYRWVKVQHQEEVRAATEPTNPYGV